jgi:hypothetical protein
VRPPSWSGGPSKTISMWLLAIYRLPARLLLSLITLVLGVPTITSNAWRRQIAFHTASAMSSPAFRNHRVGSALNASQVS